MYRYRRQPSKDVIFFLAIVAGWLAWFYHCNGYFAEPIFPLPREFLPFSVWAACSAFVTGAFLYWIDFFRPFKKFKFLPDFLALLIVLPLGGLLLRPIIGALFQSMFIRNREIISGAFVPAFLAVVIEGLGHWAKSKSSVKSTVYLALTVGETERFIDTLQSGGWEKYYRILTQEEFNGALATGGRVDYIIISRVATKNFIMHQNILQAQMRGVTILDYRTLLNQMRGHISIHDTDIWTFLAGSIGQNSFQFIYRGLKFYLEPVIAAIGLVLLLPLFIVVGILIKVTSPGPIFFRQTRTGFLGLNFELIKFRTMRVDAEAGGAQWASKSDSRITPMGRILRKSRIDELPQLINVVKGEMSFMGPRPERPEFYEIIGRQVPHFKLRLMVRPGITGWAQLLGGYAASIEESERKLESDLYYMQYLSPRMDLSILGRTVLLLLKGDSGQ